MSRYITMRTSNDCGIVAIANITGKSYEEIRDIGWKKQFRGNDDDSLWHHEIALYNLGLSAKILSKNDFMDGIFAKGKTALLMLANDTNPFSYHWFAVLEAEKRGIVVVDGFKPFPLLIRWDRVASGWGKFACVYEVNDGIVDIAWYKKLWVWLTGAMKFKLWG